MSCPSSEAHAGHYYKTNVWNPEKGKYEEKQVWCPGKVVSG